MNQEVLDTEQVKDHKGNMIPLSKARKIRGQYYLLGEDCFEFGGLYYRKESPKIVLDHSTGKYVHKNFIKGLAYGTVAPGKRGFYSNTDDSVKIASKEKDKWLSENCINDKVAVECGYIECLTNGIFYKKDDCSQGDFMGIFTRVMPPAEKVTGTYNVEDNKAYFSDLVEMYEAFRIKADKQTKRLAKRIPYSWGIEAEISNGFLPTRLRHKLGIMGLRDGSVKNTGTEYASVPYRKAKGLAVTKLLFQELSKRCVVDDSCALHYHFGDVRTDKLYALTLYTLCLKIQDELLRMFPYSRLNPKMKNNGEVKHYCRKLKDLGINMKSLSTCQTREEFEAVLVMEFNKLYRFLNLTEVGYVYNVISDIVENVVDGKPVKKKRVKLQRYTTKDTSHSVKQPKYQKDMRYYWMNLLPLYFSTFHTIEFRPHEATLNPTKAINWLCICVAILKYADNFKACAQPTITVEQVIRASWPGHLGDYLMAYFQERCRIFSRFTKDNATKAYDFEDQWFDDDEDYVFSYKGIKTIC